MRKVSAAFILSCAMLLVSLQAGATPTAAVQVYYTVSDSNVIDFTVHSDIAGSGMAVDFLGVDFASAWNFGNGWQRETYSFVLNGKSYPTKWVLYSSSYPRVPAAGNLGGFVALPSTLPVPGEIWYVAYAHDDPTIAGTGNYSGSDAVVTGTEAAWQGIARLGPAPDSAPVPVPPSLLLLAPGLVGFVGLKRRFGNR